MNDIIYINKKEITSGVYITSAIQLYISYVITGGPQLEVNQVIVLNEKWPAPAFSAGVVRYFVGNGLV